MTKDIKGFIDEETYCCGSIVATVLSYDVEEDSRHLVFKCTLCMIATKVKVD
jgi:hypothetical protein